MKSIVYSLGTFFFIGLLLFVQQSRLLDIYGITPNIFLISLFLYSHYMRVSFRGALFFSIAMELFIFLVFPFLTVWGIVALILFLLSSLFRNKITGNHFIDFMLVFSVGSALFYVVLEIVFNIGMFGFNFEMFSFVSHTFFFKEIVYNLILASIGWLFLRKTVRIQRRISKL